MRKNYYSGICLCGHSWTDHHLMLIMLAKYVEESGEGSIPGACLRYGCNEFEGLGPNGEDHCFGFVDKDNPNQDEVKRWYGTKL